MGFKLWGKKMQALSAGARAADFKLKTVDGLDFSLSHALGRGPVLLAFFKVSCPVCQFAFPFVERLFKAHGGSSVNIIGVSQSDTKDTLSFMKQFGVTFPVLLDDPKSYAVSNAYGLTNVPTLFWIAPDETIEVSSVGWMRKDIDDLNRRAAEALGHAAPPLFKQNENIPEFRAG